MAASNVISVVLHPSVIPIMDIFRSLKSLAAPHDLTLVEQAEADLQRGTTPALARAIASEALLLVLALGRHGAVPFEHHVRGSRRTSKDEISFIALVSAAAKPRDLRGVERAAAAMGVSPKDLPLSAARTLSEHIQEAGLIWPTLESVEISSGEPAIPGVVTLDDAAFKFKS